MKARWKGLVLQKLKQLLKSRQPLPPHPGGQCFAFDRSNGADCFRGFAVCKCISQCLDFYGITQCGPGSMAFDITNALSIHLG